MTVDCPNSAAFDEAYAKAKAQGLHIYRMDRMKGNAAGWVLHVQDAPEQRELITDAPRPALRTTAGNVISNPEAGLYKNEQPRFSASLSEKGVRRLEGVLGAGESKILKL
jgi:hypothetical protein